MAQVELSLNGVTLDRNVVVTLETVDGTATGVVYDVQAIYLYNVHVDVEGGSYPVCVMVYMYIPSIILYVTCSVPLSYIMYSG